MTKCGAENNDQNSEPPKLLGTTDRAWPPAGPAGEEDFWMNVWNRQASEHTGYLRSLVSADSADTGGVTVPPSRCVKTAHHDKRERG